MARPQFLWVEKYRPKTIEECILPNTIKEQMKGYVKQGDISNMTFAGKPGIGKTTVAKGLANDLNMDALIINSSDERNIDTLRTKVTRFVKSMSVNNTNPKLVIFDEADYLNPSSTQPALRNYIEEHSSYARFIFTCNYPEKLLDSLLSRNPIINFNPPSGKDEKREILRQMFNRMRFILDENEIEYDDLVLRKAVIKYYPDFRKTINEFQRYCSTGVLDESILESMDSSYESMIEHIRNRKFTELRQWIHNNPQVSFDDVVNYMNFHLFELFDINNAGRFIITLNKYAVNDRIVSDPRLNLLAFLTDIMIDGEMK